MIVIFEDLGARLREVMITMSLYQREPMLRLVDLGRMALMEQLVTLQQTRPDSYATVSHSPRYLLCS